MQEAAAAIQTAKPTTLGRKTPGSDVSGYLPTGIGINLTNDHLLILISLSVIEAYSSYPLTHLKAIAVVTCKIID